VGKGFGWLVGFANGLEEGRDDPPTFSLEELARPLPLPPLPLFPLPEPLPVVGVGEGG